MSLNSLGIFSATVNGTAGGTGPDSVTQQEGVGGISIVTYTDVGTGSYTLAMNKVIDPSEYVVMCWTQTAAGPNNITWSVAANVITVKTFDTNAATAADAIFSIVIFPIKG